MDASDLRRSQQWESVRARVERTGCRPSGHRFSLSDTAEESSVIDVTGGGLGSAGRRAAAWTSRIARRPAKKDLPRDASDGGLTVVEIESQLKFGSFRHPSGRPGRVKHNFYMNFLYFRKARQLAFHVGFEHVPHAATGGGHRHLHIDFLSALLWRRDLAGID